MEKALAAAAREGDLDEVKAILRSVRYTVDAAVTWERTPLWLAASRGHAAVCEVLLRHGARASAAAACGTTPLEAAARGGHARAVAALLGGGAAATARALELAARRDAGDVPEALVGAGAPVSARALVRARGASFRAVLAAAGDGALVAALQNDGCRARLAAFAAARFRERLEGAAMARAELDALAAEPEAREAARLDGFSLLAVDARARAEADDLKAAPEPAKAVARALLARHAAEGVPAAELWDVLAAVGEIARTSKNGACSRSDVESLAFGGRDSSSAVEALLAVDEEESPFELRRRVDALLDGAARSAGETEDLARKLAVVRRRATFRPSNRGELLLRAVVACFRGDASGRHVLSGGVVVFATREDQVDALVALDAWRRLPNPRPPAWAGPARPPTRDAWRPGGGRPLGTAKTYHEGGRDPHLIHDHSPMPSARQFFPAWRAFHDAPKRAPRASKPPRPPAALVESGLRYDVDDARDDGYGAVTLRVVLRHHARDGLAPPICELRLEGPEARAILVDG